MQKSVKINEQTHKEMQYINSITNVPICKLIDFAWSEFKNTKKYASLVLFADKK